MADDRPQPLGGPSGARGRAAALNESGSAKARGAIDSKVLRDRAECKSLASPIALNRTSDKAGGGKRKTAASATGFASSAVEAASTDTGGSTLSAVALDLRFDHVDHHARNDRPKPYRSDSYLVGNRHPRSDSYHIGRDHYFRKMVKASNTNLLDSPAHRAQRPTGGHRGACSESVFDVAAQIHP
jgi:hypothetical protein